MFPIFRIFRRLLIEKHESDHYFNVCKMQNTFEHLNIWAFESETTSWNIYLMCSYQCRVAPAVCLLWHRTLCRLSLGFFVLFFVVCFVSTVYISRLLLLWLLSLLLFLRHRIRRRCCCCRHLYSSIFFSFCPLYAYCSSIWHKITQLITLKIQSTTNAKTKQKSLNAIKDKHVLKFGSHNIKLKVITIDIVISGHS